MGVLRKITVEVDSDLLESVQKITGEGITENVRKGLEEIRRKAAYAGLLALEGKLDLGIDYKELKEDRE
jgi:hypothetical protein